MLGMFLGEGCVPMVLVGEGHGLLSTLLEEGSMHSPNQVESQIAKFSLCLPASVKSVARVYGK